MADCSKTEVFLSEFDRMCKEYKNEPCTGCPARALANAIGEKDCRKATLQMPVNLVISAVQRWSDEHPAPKPKTYADDFFEKFPHARGYSFDYDGTKVPSELMRCMLYNIGYACEFEGSKFCDADHRADCWREPYPEQEVHDG